MDYGEFERRASEVWEEIPDIYRTGVDGLVLAREEKSHPTLPEIYTLGECLTESYPSDFGGPDTTRSVLVLYYGSFRELSGLDPDFDWRYEIWETVTHELRHHLESLALEDALEGVDYAMDENFRRLDGEPFDPWFYRSGELVAPGVFEAERDVFIEVEYGSEGPPPAVEFDWGGVRYIVPVPDEAPDEAADLMFLQVVDGVDTEGSELCLVLVRRRGWLEQLRSFLGRAAPTTAQAEVMARPAEDRMP